MALKEMGIQKENADVVEKKKSGMTAAQRFKFLQGAIGIYFFFIQYGKLQEKIFQYRSPSGAKFTQVWFLQLIDAIANVIVGGLGRQFQGITPGMPHNFLVAGGVGQVVSKYCLNASLAAGLSFPVATLAKSAKMVPVMIGALLLGGAKFGARQVSQAVAIVGGTSIVTLAEGGGKNKKSTALGLLLIGVALACDGVVGGLQKRLKNELKKKGEKEKAYDLMFWSNFYMAIAALVAAALTKELRPGLAFCNANPALYQQIVKFAACGALGQACIFYTITQFDPVVCTAITTTRKLISVLLSLADGDKKLPPAGWLGISLASAGIVGEVV